ncbi:MAG: hypothetical protein ACKPKO_10650 [Candidatus Fonsibacter sp.]
MNKKIEPNVVIWMVWREGIGELGKVGGQTKQEAMQTAIKLWGGAMVNPLSFSVQLLSGEPEE